MDTEPTTSLTNSFAVQRLAARILITAITDFAELGYKRHRQRCRTGKDWLRYVDRRNSSFIPVIYRDVREKVSWLYSHQFGMIVDVLDLDLEKTQEVFLKLMAGPVFYSKHELRSMGWRECPKCKKQGDIETDFGYRTGAGKPVSQSWCKNCRREANEPREL